MPLIASLVVFLQQSLKSPAVSIIGCYSQQ
jgi:hypothetical protein